MKAESLLLNTFPAFFKDQSAFKPGFERIEALLRFLDTDLGKVNFIHVAGTNGKGSTCTYLEQIYRANGFRTGLFTSPHLLTVHERVKLDGHSISESDLLDYAERISNSGIKASFFEVMTAIAFDYFQRQEVDIAIIEVGLGGRLDSTNVITPLATALTSVGLDHVQLLGNTLEEICREKLGIVKEGIPLYVGSSVVDTLHDQVIEYCVKKEAKLVIQKCDLTDIQESNILLAKGIARELSSILAVEEIPSLIPPKGRRELMFDSDIKVYFDVAHNEEGLEWLFKVLKDKKDTGVLLSMSNDKEVESVLEDYSKAICLYTFKGEHARTFNPTGKGKKSFDTFENAYSTLRLDYPNVTEIWVVGSFYTYEEISSFFSKKVFR